MQNRFSKFLLLSVLLFLALAGCQSQPEESKEGPAAAYWKYYKACEDGKFNSAKLYLTEEAKAQNASIGACGFTHDSINRTEMESGGGERIFSDDPIVDNWTFSTNGVATMGMFDIPTFGYGPGMEKMAHTPNEYVDIDDLIKCAAFYAAYPWELINNK